MGSELVVGRQGQLQSQGEVAVGDFIKISSKLGFDRSADGFAKGPFYFQFTLKIRWSGGGGQCRN